MQITIEDISPVEKRVDFEIPWPDVAPHLEQAYAKLRREVHIKGFRPGKAPRSVLERLYKHRVEDDVARELIESSLGQAVRENQLQPVAPPTVDKIELRNGTPFKFSAKVEVRSQVAPKDYAGIPLVRRPARASDEEIAQALESYRRRMTEFVPVADRKVTAPSDVILVDLRGEVGDMQVRKTDKEALLVDLDDDKGGPVPGVVPLLRGLSIEGKHKLEYTLPDDVEPKVLAGKKVRLEVVIKEVREKKVPPLDDELAKDTGEADTLEALRAKVKERLLDADKQRIQRELVQTLIKELVKRNDFAIAHGLVDRHAEAIVNRARAQLIMAGVMDADAPFDVDKMKHDFHAEAEEEARGTVLLQAIAEREGLTVADADVQKKLAELASARNENVKKLRAEYEKSGRIHGLRAQLLEQKTLDMLIAQAKITDGDPERLIVTPEEARAEAAGKKSKRK